MAEQKKPSSDELTKSYLEWTSNEINNFQNILESYQEGFSADQYKNNLEALYAISHNIKGMGGSFGYDLMSEVGTSLTQYCLSCEDNANNVNLKLLRAYADIMNIIIDNSISGHGGKAGQNMINTLKNLVAREAL